MKHNALFAAMVAALLFVGPALFAQIRWYDGTELSLEGKILPTQNPYHRADTSKYAFVGHERTLMLCSAGLRLHFKTNSKSIKMKPEYGYIYGGTTTTALSYKGFDLYIKDGDKWLWAAAATSSKPEFNLITNMDGSEHECLLYLPMYSELLSLKVGFDEGSTVVPCKREDGLRLGVFGSSFSMGVSTSRAGMSYPMQLARKTGLNVLSLAASGNCKLQQSFADAIADADIDALLLDTFSNPSIEQVETRLFPFIETVQAAHPDIPLIFQRTIYRESRNFNTRNAAFEKRRIEVADSLMAIACKKYKNIYYIYPNATTKSHETSVDGTHPCDYGYTLWEQSIEKKVLAILKKYYKLH